MGMELYPRVSPETPPALLQVAEGVWQGGCAVPHTSIIEETVEDGEERDEGKVLEVVKLSARLEPMGTPFGGRCRTCGFDLSQNCLTPFVFSFFVALISSVLLFVFS